MRFPSVPFSGLKELAEKWGVDPCLVVKWAIDGHIRLWAVVPPIHTTPGRVISGTVEIEPAECLRLFHPNGPDTINLQRVKHTQGGAWEDVTKPAGGFAIGIHDVIILAAETERFERKASDAAPEPPEKPVVIEEKPSTQKWQPGPGRSATHDWEAMHAEVTRIIYEEGVPASLGELTRKIEAWFTTEFRNAPDERTISRKLSPTWWKLQEKAPGQTTRKTR
ncbi:MAG TPA: hypothetical protein VIM56_06365 [Rhizomicrobium sp.]